MSKTILLTSYCIREGGVLQLWANFELYPREALETSLARSAGEMAPTVKPGHIYLAVDPNGSTTRKTFINCSTRSFA